MNITLYNYGRKRDPEMCVHTYGFLLFITLLMIRFMYKLSLFDVHTLRRMGYIIISVAVPFLSLIQMDGVHPTYLSRLYGGPVIIKGTLIMYDSRRVIKSRT